MKNFQIQRLISLPGIYLFLLKKLAKQKRFLKKEIKKELQVFRNDHDGSLKPSDFRKITSYYALGVPGVLGETLCILRGKSLDKEERFCLSYLGGISGLLDDLFDDPEKEAVHLKKFISEPENLDPTNSHEALLQQFYLQGLSYTENPLLLKEQAQEVFNSQQKSLQQQKKDVTVEQIKEITYSKGGSAFVFYRLCLNKTMEEAERKFLYQLGSVMQLGNDIFDVWKDFNSETETAATKTNDIQKLRNFFMEELVKTYRLAGKTSYPPGKINQFIAITDLALARVFVCLYQFEKLQKKSGGVFSIVDYSRKELICDMQKPANQLRAIKYYLSPVINIRKI